jgi:hypothetical protein
LGTTALVNKNTATITPITYTLIKIARQTLILEVCEVNDELYRALIAEYDM